MEYKMKNLGDICDIQGGYAFKSKDFISTGIPVVKIANINDKIIEFNNKTVYLSKEYLDKYLNYKINNGDILIALSGATTGKFGIYDKNEPALLNQRVGRIIPNKTQIFSKYIYYYMNKLKDSIFKKAGGAAQPNISPIDIKEMPILIPPLPIQKKITKALDKAQELIDKRKEQIESLDEFIQSVFLDMFGDPVKNPKGWEVKNLKEGIKDVKNGLSRRRKTSENIGQIVFRLRDIRSNKIDYSDLNRIELNEKEKSKYSINKGDLLFIRVNGNPEYVGRCAIFEDYSEKVYFNDHIMRVSVDNTCLNCIFISYFLNGSFGKLQIRKYRMTSAGQYTINQKGLEKIKIIVPPLDLQNKFASIVQKTETQKELLQNSLKELENNFNCLMQKAFKGELFNS